MKYLVHFLTAFVLSTFVLSLLGLVSVGISAACTMWGCSSTEMLAGVAVCSLGSAIYVAFE